MKSKIIIICGLPGAGKTTLASRLSAKLNTVCIHKDTLKENLFELFDANTLEESIAYGKKSIGLLFRLAEEQMSRNIDIIIESPFIFNEDYCRMKTWESTYNVEIVKVVCHLDEEERRRRIINRMKTSRHYAHFDQERIFKYSAHDYSVMPGKEIKVNCKEPLDKLVKLIVSEI